MSNAKKYPQEDGWITATLTPNKGKTLTEEIVKGFLSMGKPEQCEFGPITIGARTTKAIYREVKQPA